MNPALCLAACERIAVGGLQVRIELGSMFGNCASFGFGRGSAPTLSIPTALS
jgi:hypothetical protein